LQRLNVIVDLRSLLSSTGGISRKGLSLIGEIHALAQRLEVDEHRPKIDLQLTHMPDQEDSSLNSQFKAAIGNKIPVCSVSEIDDELESVADLNTLSDNLFITAGGLEQMSGKMDCWMIGDDPVSEIKIEDISRRISEKLDIPIARPIDPARRKGELLALDQPAGDCDLSSLAFEYPETDWITVGDVRFLYLENADKADEIETQSGAKRISYSVSKPAIFLTKEDTETTQYDAKKIACEGGWQLWEAPYEAIDKFKGDPGAISFADWSLNEQR